MSDKYRVIEHPRSLLDYKFHVQRKRLWFSWVTIEVFKTKEEAISFAEYKNGNIKVIHEC